MGIDVGSVSTNFVITGENDSIIEKLYLKTAGRPVETLKEGLEIMRDKLGDNAGIAGVGTTGSGRQLAAIITGADIVKNEITAHAYAALKIVPGVNTVLEIGGQDSKIIILRNGIVHDFAMNTVCAAGTGSFLDRQASRLNIPIEKFGELALQSKTAVRIAGRCAVFAESDMIHKQQMGHSIPDIVNGLCEALVRNYLNNIAKGKELKSPIVFQGGVAANVGIAAAFEKALGKKVIIPPYHDVMGAYGAALISRQYIETHNTISGFYGFNITRNKYNTKSFICDGCSNMCEIVEISANEKPLARWGDRCGKWSNSLPVAEYANN